ncbi:TPA: hypothetical protein ACTUT5_003448 [Legionella anisa]|uniref:hypothetical protein n=1 Tax=Legionella anisa TaxID=28082 RepID=UPI001981472E|nr:hypothetical protein [Legionella anisa]MBN5937377.1 hypothetical protein [Legionella anisa]
MLHQSYALFTELKLPSIGFDDAMGLGRPISKSEQLELKFISHIIKTFIISSITVHVR